MEFGELWRRAAYNGIDALRGSRLARLKAVNKREITEGITPAYEKKELSRALEWAALMSPYYRARLPERPSLSDFPVMTKREYVEHFDEILTDPYRNKQDRLFRLSTSGSTGAPFTVLANAGKMERINMNFISFMELNGFRFGMKRAETRVWIKGKNVRSPWRLFKTNLVPIDIANMGDDSLAEICEQIRRERVQVLVCYSSALTVIADYLKRTNYDLSQWIVEMVFAMGEGLPDETYNVVKEVFGFAPVRSYGNNENGFMACTVGEDKLYTCDLYNFYFELLALDSDEPVEEGQLGRIVVTDYYHKAFPMIRYDTGDTGIILRTTDENGRKKAYFSEIYGRRGSMLYNTKGEPLSIHVFLNVLINLEDVVYQAKCIQWDKKRYELVLCGDRGRIDEEEIKALYRTYLGDDAEIEVSYVDDIPVEASGKRMAAVQKCEAYL